MPMMTRQSKRVLPFDLPNRYEFVGPVIKGGQGEVYVCSDKFLERKVAIKVMTELNDSEEIRKELAAIQSVQSRHVARIFDVVNSEDAQTMGLVEEYVPGPDVAAYAAANDIKDECLAILYQIACGLCDIHVSGKIHRDIKPRNIKFDGEHIVKILDFGLASDALPDIETVDARGTPCYLAPELYGDPPISYTAAVDTFAFGVTARVIAQGGALPPAFRQTPPYATAFPSFGSCPIPLPPDITAILDRTLSVDPGHRPAMVEVRDVLARRLLWGKHRAVITYGANHELSVPGKSVALKVGSDGLTIAYDGLYFTVNSVSGAVYVNNLPVITGTSLPDSCVITLGPPQLGWDRAHVPFNVSHPEVVL